MTLRIVATDPKFNAISQEINSFNESNIAECLFYAGLTFSDVLNGDKIRKLKSIRFLMLLHHQNMEIREIVKCCPLIRKSLFDCKMLIALQVINSTISSNITGRHHR